MFRRARLALLAAGVALGMTVTGAAGAAGASSSAAAAASFPNVVVPVPVSETANGSTFTLASAATLTADDANVGGYLAGILRASTGYALPLTVGAAAPGTIALSLSGAPATVGAEGYQLTIKASSVLLQANSAAGLFHGVQTLLQLLPAQVMSPAKVTSVAWKATGGTILDYPRFGYRGAMLDVARHFFTVAQVEHYIDELSLYKVNYLHLHLSDDQGWRIAINSWPNLATTGGSTEVGGGAGGYYTQADYTTIVNYAASHYMTLVPEIDTPGHTNAALASYAALNCNGVAPPLYTGTDVGFSSLCVSLPLTYTFLDQVVGELAALTPGPYIHIGGDEASSTSQSDYTSFITKAQQIVGNHGKAVMGWHNIAAATLAPSTLAQFWDTTKSNSALAAAAAKGTKIVMSPANHAYLDMKYTKKTTLGQNWAGYVDVNAAYGWDPGNYLSGVSASAIAGVEAPLWSETLVTSANIDYMAFPRLPALMELGWSPESTHNQTSFDARLGAQGPRWHAMGVDYYKSTQVKWPSGS
ncbi:Beta-N-acetylhexosaminidase [Catenulispora acidiphila DSM 44928]|uniref:beta-N-acetylhexosaminidase n=2 Tax=Catenulispora TaxID=414878 RepID=C7QI70_CATAD|nr:Beta-N-acetylhexosaminidase [Catenulispora acidiphila DSM 44928]